MTRVFSHPLVLRRSGLNTALPDAEDEAEAEDEEEEDPEDPGRGVPQTAHTEYPGALCIVHAPQDHSAPPWSPEPASGIPQTAHLVAPAAFR